jgi:pyruvate dehydrogenase E2 component (dihydrolipoamide acetyltransferase)
VSTDVVMPRLSDSMEEGTVVQWLKQVGDHVKAGEPLVEIETDKATVIAEGDDTGTLVEILVPAGQTASLGAVIARLADPSGQPGAQPASAGASRRERHRERRLARGLDGRVDASPVARRVAGELGVDLEALHGSGPRGRVIKRDVHAARARKVGVAGTNGEVTESVRLSEPVGATITPPPATLPLRPAAPLVGPAGRATSEEGKGPVQFVPFTRLQQTVARRMAESKAAIPEFTLFRDVDMAACVELRARLKQLVPDPPSYNDLIVKASALALREHPRANGAYREGGMELYGAINVGVAVAREDALVVPTLLDADRKSLGEIARESRRLAAAVRDGTVTPAELSGGTFTVSNLGMYGVGSFAAIVNPGQAAILSVGAMAKRPVATAEGELVVRDVLTLGLICDHRVLYGAGAAAFLGRLCELLEQPLSIAL